MCCFYEVVNLPTFHPLSQVKRKGTKSKRFMEKILLMWHTSTHLNVYSFGFCDWWVCADRHKYLVLSLGWKVLIVVTILYEVGSQYSNLCEVDSQHPIMTPESKHLAIVDQCKCWPLNILEAFSIFGDTLIGDSKCLDCHFKRPGSDSKRCGGHFKR